MPSSPEQEEYLLFTAYSMTSAFAQNGFCFTVSGASTALQMPYSVIRPATATKDPAQYSSAAATWFVNHLNVPDWGICGGNGSLAVHMTDVGTTATTAAAVVVQVAVPTLLVAVSQTSSSSSSSLPPPSNTPSSLPATTSTGLGTKAEVAVVIAFVVVALLLVSWLFFWFRYMKQQRAGVVERKGSDKLEKETGTDKETEAGFVQ